MHGPELHNVSKNVLIANGRDTIQVLRSHFTSGELRELESGLQLAQHRSQVSQELDTALRDSRTKLLLTAVEEENWPKLIESIRALPTPRSFPILGVVRQSLYNSNIDLLVPEIDDLLIEPVNVQNVCFRIERLTEQYSKRRDEVERIKQNLIANFGMLHFIGQAPAFLAAVEKIPLVADCDAGVLLTGETGTGKELFARAIHYTSSRANRPFLPVNCGAIPADLFENEMFGHEPGAFTDARHSRRGLIAEAEGGTLFLDEVDSLAPSAQVKLLRFIQDGQYKPLGSTVSRQADVRLIAASNKDLRERMQSGSFRADLFYRLNVVSLQLPPLRERREDIIPLAFHFLETAAWRYRRPVVSLSKGAIHKLVSYSWPGNVRELENTVHHAVILTSRNVISAQKIKLGSDDHLSATQPRESLKVAKARVVAEFEQNYLRELLTMCDGNISRAAREADKDRRTFFGLLKKYGLLDTPGQLP
jgi:DNA-binding NtrC family response regulator